MMKASTYFSPGYFQPASKDAKPQQKFSGLLTLFSWLGQALTASNSEPRIRQAIDRHGMPYWHVYDPVTGRSAAFTDEDEVYTWIEQRYYQ